jgi:hypothetical protein
MTTKRIPSDNADEKAPENPAETKETPGPSPAQPGDSIPGLSLEQTEPKPKFSSFGLSLIVLAGLTAGGILSSFVLGPLDLSAVSYPVNYYLGALIILLGLSSVPLRKHPFIRFISGGSFASALILYLLLFSLVMGLIPQHEGHALSANSSFLEKLGVFSVTSSGPFVFLYFMTLVSLSMVVARSFVRPVKPFFLLNHLGILLVLLSAGLGAPDREKHIMTVMEGGLEWRVQGKVEDEILELPIAIRLLDFSMEEYPAKLAVIRKNEGTVLPKEKPQFFFLDDISSQKGLLDFEIKVLEFLKKGVPVGGGNFARGIMEESAQAVKIAVTNSGSGFSKEGWVSAGNRIVTPHPFGLDDDRLIVMTRPDPRRFISRIKVFTKEGVEKEGTVLVNRPMKAGYWQVYQHGYDNDAGNLSRWSSFLLVKDPVLYPALIGFILLFVGTMGMAVLGKASEKIRITKEKISIGKDLNNSQEATQTTPDLEIPDFKANSPDGGIPMGEPHGDPSISPSSPGDEEDSPQGPRK